MERSYLKPAPDHVTQSALFTTRFSSIAFFYEEIFHARGDNSAKFAFAGPLLSVMECDFEIFSDVDELAIAAGFIGVLIRGLFQRVLASFRSIATEF